MFQRWILSVVCAFVGAASLHAWAADKRPAVKTATGTDWPQWRGNNRDGISTDSGLLESWPKDGPALAWKTSGLGKGFSSVSLADGRIFTMGDRAAGEFVIALNAADGKELWSSRISDVWAPDGYAGPRATPTIDGDRLYGVGPHGDLVCLEAATGKQIWHRNMQADFGGQMHSGWGYSESPLIDGERLICTPGGREAALVALDKKTGDEIWRTSVGNPGDKGSDGAAYSSIVVSHAGGIKQYVQLMGRGAVGVAAKDGKLLWTYNRVANGTANISTPVVHDDYVFVSSGYQTGAALLHLQKTGDGIKADEVYFLDGKQFQNHHGGMILLGDYLYAGHGHNAGAPTCLDLKTGKTVWRHNHGPGKGSACISLADGNLYFRFEDGVMALIGATPDGYQEKSTFQIPDVNAPSWAHPVIAGGRMYLREQDSLYCYNIKK